MKFTNLDKFLVSLGQFFSGEQAIAQVLLPHYVQRLEFHPEFRSALLRIPAGFLGRRRRGQKVFAGQFDHQVRAATAHLRSLMPE